jgi:mannobiose 2-epimerase
LIWPKRAFAWLETHAHDPKNGGYYEQLTREGKPILSPPGTAKTDVVGAGYGFKSMNSHIHLLEAFTALYEIWPDATLRRRLREVFEIVRDKIAVEPAA